MALNFSKIYFTTRRALKNEKIFLQKLRQILRQILCIRILFLQKNRPRLQIIACGILINFGLAALIERKTLVIVDSVIGVLLKTLYSFGDSKKSDSKFFSEYAVDVICVASNINKHQLIYQNFKVPRQVFLGDWECRGRLSVGVKAFQSKSYWVKGQYFYAKKNTVLKKYKILQYLSY